MMHVPQVELDDFVEARPKRGRRPACYLPGGSGVYALHLCGEPIYIGMSSCIDQRVRQHVSIPRDKVTFHECDESSARWIEKRLLAKHRPRFNVRGT